MFGRKKGNKRKEKNFKKRITEKQKIMIYLNQPRDAKEKSKVINEKKIHSKNGLQRNKTKNDDTSEPTS